MGLPPQIPGRPPGGHQHPFGPKAFRAGLIGCAASVALAAAMVAFGDEDVAAVGVSLLVLAGVCLATVGVLAGAERLLGRRRGAPPDPGANGHDPEPPRFVRRRGS